MRPTRTWILIADGRRARLLENLGPGKGVHQVPGSSETIELPPSRAIFSDRAGRAFESQGTTRHAMESRSDPHRELKRGFARHLAELLETHRLAHAFDRLVLVAPPAMLGDLRAALGDAVAAMVIGEIAEDLTRTPTQDIARHLEGVMVP